MPPWSSPSTVCESDRAQDVKDVVLVGGGHSHVGVLKRLAARPIPGARLTLICTDLRTPYSGMLPGYVAGHYTYDEVHIDVSRLAAFAGASLHHDEVVGVDRAARTVLCRSGPPIPFDLLSLDIGSTPQQHHVPGAAEFAVGVKPIARFNDRWLALLDRVRSQPGRTTVAVVGAGAGGVELLLAMQYRLRDTVRAQGRSADELEFHLFAHGHEILPTHSPGVRRRFEAVLRRRRVVVHRNAAVTEVKPGRLQTVSGDAVDADEVVWVTSAGGAAWLRGTGLALDPDGFIQTADTLQTVSDAEIFATGDSATMVNFRLEKAGVVAVRQARPLTENLRRAVRDTPLKPYRPQRNWLALISTGDRYAVASRGWLGIGGRWVWRWKDRIDRRFMRNYRHLPSKTSRAQ